MHNDLAAGNRLEAPWLSGAVARMSAESKLAAPVSATLYAAVKPYVDGAPQPEGGSRMRLILTWLINAVALFALPYIFTSITVDSFVTALIVAVVLGPHQHADPADPRAAHAAGRRSSRSACSSS